MAPAQRNATVLVLAYLAFVSLGLPDTVLGVAWPSLRDTFAVRQSALGVPLAVAATTYFLAALVAGRLMARAGVGTLLAGSTALATLGVLGYATAPTFAMVLVAASIVGLGSGAIDAAMNAYAARHFGAAHMTWLHAAYSAGAALGPVIMTALLATAGGWRAGYAAVGAALGALAVAFVATRARWGRAPAQSVDAPGEAGTEALRTTSGTAALRHPHVRLLVALFFVYTGCEMAAGQWSYTLFTEARGVDETTAGAWVATYWGGLLAGRVLLGFVVERIGPVRLVRLATVGALAGTLLLALPGAPAGLGAVGLALTGFSFAPIYPCLMAETPRRVGDAIAPHAVGFQVSAGTLGVALVPGALGVAAEKLGLPVIAPLLVGGTVVLTALHELVVRTADREC